MLKSLELPQKIEILSNGIKSKASVVARTNFFVSDIIYIAKNAFEITKPTYQTVQVSEHIHSFDIVFAHLNHSCNPNTYIDCSLKYLSLIAQRSIFSGEELNFFYPATEWQMARPFNCSCGTSNCLLRVTGSQTISSRILKAYKINEHITRLKGD